MKTMQVPIRNRDGFTSIAGYPTGVPGLAIHREWTENGKRYNSWDITHTPSGERVIRGCSSRKAAFAVTHKLGQAADWTRPADALRLTPGLSDIVRELQWGGR